MEAVVERQQDGERLGRVDGADDQMMIAVGIGQYDRSFAAGLRVQRGVGQVELFEPSGRAKDGRRGLKQQDAGDKLGPPEDRGLTGGAVGIQQESATPIAGRRSYAAMKRLAGQAGVPRRRS